MPREHVLITVKTYPTLSQKHVELVCTAGFREDGSWVRIYPVPFRLLSQELQFPKWTWISLPLIRRTRDRRPESFSPIDRDDIEIGGRIPTTDSWRERRSWALSKGRVWSNLSELIEAGKQDEVSLATFRPAEMLAFEWDAASEDWESNKLAAVESQLRQMNFLEPESLQQEFKPAKKVPFDFYYRFRDEAGRESRMRILDWEIGMLYWKCRRNAHSDADALEKVRQRYQNEFFHKDLHLFLGTTYEWHSRAPNPWVIVGVFPPPITPQLELEMY